MAAESAEFHVNGCLDVMQLNDKKAQRAKRTNSAVLVSPQQVPSRSLASSTPLVKCEVVGPSSASLATTSGGSSSAVDDLFAQIENTPLVPESAGEGSCKYVYKKPLDCVTRLKPSGAARQPKPLPAYKTMPKTTFTVDAFNYGNLEFCTAYFLTHFHSDHYGGLTKSGFAGHIYCSRITANCVVSKIGVDTRQVHALPMNTRCVVQDVYVTLVDAEHCPGAAIILFEVPVAGGQLLRIVHTGDFRASKQHVDQISCVFSTPLSNPVTPSMLGDSAKCRDAAARGSPLIDYVYLDTTYLEPSYSFPCQSQVIATVGAACYKIHSSPAFLSTLLNQASKGSASHKRQSTPTLSDDSSRSDQPTKRSMQITQWFKPLQKLLALPASAPPSVGEHKKRVLFVVGTYTIGKEKLFVEIARRLQSKVYVSQEKRKLLECIESPALMSLLTDNMFEAQVHAVAMNKVNVRGMTEYLQLVRQKSTFTSVVAFSPTGWTHAGPYIPAHVSSVSAVVPQRPASTELDSHFATGGAAGLVSALAAAARLYDDDSGRAFGFDRLKLRGSSNCVTIIPVPYSEHSSFAELARFVCSLNCTHVVPTVFSTAAKNQQASDWLRHWHELKQTYNSRVHGSAAGHVNAHLAAFGTGIGLQNPQTST
ncbi:repair protein PSO2 SNM1 [Coemansia thaxteri]|nr:repair protein PSO2 SNM1 [Coemansia thaxteri]